MLLNSESVQHPDKMGHLLVIFVTWHEVDIHISSTLQQIEHRCHFLYFLVLQIWAIPPPSDTNTNIHWSAIFLRVIIWARKIICFVFSFWFRYDFVIVLIWFWHAWKYVFFNGLQACFQRDMIFDMVFLWCKTASIIAKMFNFNHIAWNQEISTILCLHKVATFSIIYLDSQKWKWLLPNLMYSWSYFRDSGRCGSDALKFFPIWNKFP